MSCGVVLHLARAIRAENLATRQGAGRPSTRQTGNVHGGIAGLNDAPVSSVVRSSKSKSIRGLWIHALAMPVCTGCSGRLSTRGCPLRPSLPSTSYTLLMSGTDGLARNWATAPRRNCLKSSSTLFMLPLAATAPSRMQANACHPDRRSM
jgi:hypothetical protein